MLLSYTVRKNFSGNRELAALEEAMRWLEKSGKLRKTGARVPRSYRQAEFAPAPASIDRLVDRVVDTALTLFSELPKTPPFRPGRITAQMTRTPAGGFYKVHTDNGRRPGSRVYDRFCSFVLYLDRPFRGGALRFHPTRAKFRGNSFMGVRPEGEGVEKDWEDVQPEPGMLAVFPCWQRHEIRPVEAGERCTLNGWISRA